MTIILAHRGASGTHPENTMEAFIAAEKFGADGIELDVQLTADGEIVVIHDITVDRTTNGSGHIKDLTLNELKNLKANFHYKHFFKKAARIPTLREVFDWMSENDLICNIELKNNSFPYEGLEEKVIAITKEFAFEKRIIISSFNHYSLVYVKKICSDIETAPLYKDLLYKPWEYASSILSNGIHPKLKAVSDSIIKATMEQGIAVRPYTINKERDINRLLSLNCSAIITDYPEKAIRLREKIKKSKRI